jgi:hypothetical protein
MTAYYVYLKSNCCNALIHNGLANIKNLNKCNDCNKVLDIIKDSYDTKGVEYWESVS